MLLNLSEFSDEPLHGQVSRQIRAQILAGHLLPGYGLPSIRRLAREQRVSVITVQRAYDDLEGEGLLHSRRGKGFFVRDLSAAKRLRLARARARTVLDVAVAQARAEGLSSDQIRELLNLAMSAQAAGDGESRA